MEINSGISLGHFSSAWFVTNASHVLRDGQIVYLKDDSGQFKKGDGVRLLSALPWLGGGSDTISLANTKMLVGNASNEAAEVSLTLSATPGVFALANTGVLTMPNASPITRGLLSNSDWVSFNDKVPSSRSVSTSSPLSGGGILSGNLTLSISQSGISSDGFLSSTDWNTFNSKEPSLAAGTTAQYYRGDKSWQTLSTEVESVVNPLLTLKADLASPTFTGVATFQNIIRLTSAALGTAVAGNIEFLTDKYYGVISTGTSRREIALNESSLTNTGIVYANSSGRLVTSSTSGVVTNGSSISIGALATGGYNGSYGAYNSRHVGIAINRAFVAEHANASGYVVNELRGSGSSGNFQPVFWNAVYSYATSGNYTGTSIPVASTCLINASISNYASAGTATGTLVSAALTHYVLAGTTGASVGLVHGASGIRIDTINALHNALSSGVSLHINTGILRYSSRQIGNAGLSSGDVYVDTAANILANGDYVVGMKA